MSASQDIEAYYKSLRHFDINNDLEVALKKRINRLRQQKV